MHEAATWDRLADRYDLIVRAFDRSYPAVRDALRRDLAGGGRVLELAAGTGQLTPALAEVAREVVATDVSPRMVRGLRDATATLPEVTVKVARADAIDADDASFDAVVCANALHVMERPEVALREMRRVVAPGGLVITPTFLHGHDRARRTLSRALSAVSPFVAHTRLDLDALVAMVRAAGLEPVRQETLGGVFPIGYVAARRPDDDGADVSSR